MVSLTEELNMVRIKVTKDFGEGVETVVISYGISGYSSPIEGMTYLEPSAEIADSFVGASMFGWDAPIADLAHKWVADL